MNLDLPATDSVIAGKFRVIRMLGRGGMGVVLEAENLVTCKRVAVKCLHPFMAGQADLAARLVREARASARVRHPNVVDVYDVVQEGQQVFLVMELLEGEPLSGVLRRGGMPLHELVALLLAGMRGVAAAHAKGVIHRDIKPDNIFVAHVPGEPSVVKVLDFGISKLQDSQRGSLSHSGVVGTPLYMSYEQLCNLPDIDARSDVYAFGVILYEAMTGQCPFQADSFPALAVKIMEASPIAPRVLQPSLPTSFERAILKAMARDREQRTPSMAALIQELTPFSTEAGFRLEMSSDQRSLPRVIARGSDPAGALAPTQSQSRPRNAHVAVQSIHVAVSGTFRRARRLWLVFAVLVGAFFAYRAWHQSEVDKPVAGAALQAGLPKSDVEPAPALETSAPAAKPDVEQVVARPGVEEADVKGGAGAAAVAVPSPAPSSTPKKRSRATQPRRATASAAPTLQVPGTAEQSAPKTSTSRIRAGRAPEREEF